MHGGTQGTKVRLYKVTLRNASLLKKESDCEVFCVAFNARYVNMKRVRKNK